jgi:hypothetical protein
MHGNMNIKCAPVFRKSVYLQLRPRQPSRLEGRRSSAVISWDKNLDIKQLSSESILSDIMKYFNVGLESLVSFGATFFIINKRTRT